MRLAEADPASDLEAYLDEARMLVSAELELTLPEERNSAGLYALMREYPLRHGKALRPAICIAATACSGGNVRDILPTATVFELYHNAFLIHDDVEDGSLVRRHEATLHEKYGIPVAVNVADGLLAVAMQPLLKNTERVGLGRALRILDLVAAMARESAEGQMLELSWQRPKVFPGQADYVRMVYKKTAWYSFIAPAMAGALAAGSGARELRLWRGAMTLLGIAFQITDDYLNLFSQRNVGKESDGDLWEGKMSLMLLITMARCSRRDRETASQMLRLRRPPPRSSTLETAVISELQAGGLSAPVADRLQDALTHGLRTQDQVNWLRTLMTRHAAPASAMRVARQYARTGRQRLGALQLPPSTHRSFLESLFDYVTERDC